MTRPLQSLALRRAIITRLRADASLIAIGETPISQVTPPDPIRVYGRRSPALLTWPFCRINVADEGPLRKGSLVRVTGHTFSKTTFDDEIEQLDAAMVQSLDDAVLELGPGTTARLRWLQSQVIPDASEADAWHGVNSFDAMIG